MDVLGNTASSSEGLKEGPGGSQEVTIPQKAPVIFDFHDNFILSRL